MNATDKQQASPLIELTQFGKQNEPVFVHVDDIKLIIQYDGSEFPKPGDRRCRIETSQSSFLVVESANEVRLLMDQRIVATQETE
jgi:hypothetical protein